MARLDQNLTVTTSIKWWCSPLLYATQFVVRVTNAARSRPAAPPGSVTDIIASYVVSTIVSRGLTVTVE